MNEMIVFDIIQPDVAKKVLTHYYYDWARDAVFIETRIT